MDKQIQKLKKMADNFLHISREDIRKTCGKPLKHSDNEVWLYNKYRWGIFRDETTFIFEEDTVTDIMIAHIFFGKSIKIYSIMKEKIMNIK